MLQTLRLALCPVVKLCSTTGLSVLMITAVSCGEGDPPGGGNGNGDTDGGGTTDGTTGNGGRTDGHVPNPNNPLIAVIPGLWREVRINGQPADPPYEGRAREVDAEDPDCTEALEEAPVDYRSVGPPGDACIHWDLRVDWWILDGSRVRHEDPIFRIAGDVLDGGWRIVIMLTNAELGTSGVIEYEKIE